MASSRRKAGVLSPHVEGYRAWLARHGYTGQSIRNMLKDLGQAPWLSGQGLEAPIWTRNGWSSICPTCGRRVAVGWPGRAGWFRC